MPNSILIPIAIDHEPTASQKIAIARSLLEPNGRITLLTVLEQIPGYVTEFVTIKSENHLTNLILEKLKVVAEDAKDIDCKVVTGKAADRISAVAREVNADLIIVGAHDPSVIDYFLGSTASRVVRRAPCSVYVLR